MTRLRAVTSTTDARTARLAMSVTVNAGTGPATGMSGDGVIDFAKPSAELTVTTTASGSPDVPAKLRSSLGRLRSTFGKGRSPVDVWVDGGGRLRRVLMVMRVDRGATEMRVQEDFYGFGVPVHVAVPPAGSVIAMPSRLSTAPSGT